MRVLHLISAPTMTGPADPALGLARAQRAEGIDAQLACDRVREGDMVEKTKAAQVPLVDGLSLCTKGSLSMALADRRALRSLAEDFDLVHVHSSHDHTLSVLAKLKTPLVRTIHHPRSARRRGLQGVAYRRTNGLILIAQAHRTLLQKSYPALHAERMTVIPGGVSTLRFHPEVDPSAVQLELSLGERPVIGIVARIKPGRGHAMLLEAFAELRERFPADRGPLLGLIGKGEGVPEITEKVESMGLAPQVRFFGFRDADLPQAIKCCAFTVLLAEGNDAGCRAVLESMAVGVPVIATKMPATEDAVDEPATGLLIPPGDRRALVESMMRMLDLNEEARAQMGKQARARVLERFSDRARARATTAFYEDIIALGPRP